MKNININVTAQQAKLIDKTAEDRGFANRSEFFRSLLRYVFLYSPQLLSKLDTASFEEPPTKDPDYIIAELKKTDKYTKKFIESVSQGLKESEYFSK